MFVVFGHVCHSEAHGVEPLALLVLLFITEAFGLESYVCVIERVPLIFVFLIDQFQLSSMCLMNGCFISVYE